MAFFGGGGSSVDLASPSAIGSTTPNTGAFTTLSFAPANNTTGFSNTGNSLTGSNAQSLVSLAQTWNTTGTPTLINVAVTNTASNAASKFIDCKVGSDSKFHVTRTGKIWTPAGLVGSNGGVGTDGLALEAVFSSYGIGFNADGSVISVTNNKQTAVLGFQCIVNNVAYFGFSASEEVNTNATKDVRLFRDAAAVLAQRNATNAQTFRIYNTFTDSSNYERGFVRWNSNVLEVGTEVAGTGTARNIRILTRASGNYVALGTGSANGFGINGDGVPAIVVNSVERCSFSASLLALQADANIGISFSSGQAYQADTFIRRDGTGNTLAMRNGANSQTLRLYRTFTDSSNYERLAITATGTTRFGILAQNAGTGVARQIEISYYTSANDPTSTDITDGAFGVWKNSGTGTIKLWANDGGTMKSVALA